MSSSDDWAAARKILCVRLDGLGDLLMTTPAIRALKESAPGRHITLLTSAAGAQVASLIPEIDEIIVYDAPWLKATEPRQDNEPDFEMIRRLCLAGYEAAVIFTVYSQNPLPAAFLCYLAGIPLRLAHCRENPYQLLTDWIGESEPERQIRHEVQRQLDLVANVGFRTRRAELSLRVPASARRRVRRLLSQSLPADARRWVLIHPGATAPSRRYRPEGFAEVARHLGLEYGLPVVFSGSQDELGLVQEIQAALTIPSLSLAGRLNLAEMVALVAEAPLLISNNSGPVHIASAVNTSVVDLYALTNPQHTPWAVPSRVLSHDVPCKYCYKSVCPEGHHNCLRLVQPAEVVAAAVELLGMTSSRSGGLVTPSTDEQMARLVEQLNQMPGLDDQLPMEQGQIVRLALEGNSVHDIANQTRVTEATVWEILNNAARLATGQSPSQRVEQAGLGSDTDPGISGGYGDTGFGSLGNEGPGMPNPDEP